VATVFARNHWYVIAAADEVGDQPLGRVVLGEPVVLFRDAGAAVVALADRCSHRRYPLSRGSVGEGQLTCGYHGFTFDGGGRCVAVPGQDHIPSRADVRRYPVVEKGPWLFVWMGDPEAPEGDRLPELAFLTSPGWTEVHGMQVLGARYELLVDNLLDLSHETYLHAGLIGTPEVAATPIETEVDEAAGVVRVSRHMDGAECPPFYARSTGLASPIDRWQDIEFHTPGIYLLHSRIAPAGAEPGPGDGAAHAEILYGITPSTTTTTYDFWLVARDFAPADDEVSEFLARMNDAVVAQDVAALGVLEQRVAAEPDGFEVNVRIDRGGLHARRLIRDLIAAEAGAPAADGPT
jgi:phenylpropionate dioxygenase-like ring-hydroxylating dioxygenase large terminal subunit